MSGNQVSVLVTAAQRLRMEPRDYAARLLAGERWCWGCRAWHQESQFGTDRTRPDAIAAVCRDFKNRRARELYTPPSVGRAGPDAPARPPHGASGPPVD